MVEIVMPPPWAGSCASAEVSALTATVVRSLTVSPPMMVEAKAAPAVQAAPAAVPKAAAVAAAEPNEKAPATKAATAGISPP
ncbi:hypothetical protein A6J80_23555 [Paracoccus yeei]|uniref:Uncharacterized protein n=1 Tax=Paracoccus yeei TaxID=147645 RepID=A0A2P1BUA1_9RHOB|nr:hypothetical protein A6J80_23555 [Paracoccus yeei]